MESFIVIVGIIQFFVLIIFFQIAGNIEALRIRFTSKNPETWLKKYQKSISLRRDSEALYHLQEFVWESLQRKKSKAKYDSLKSEYESAFTSLGAEFPIYPFND
ncbi:hypothetical protein [Pedobacter antarcticus]|uniref:hypothetical protein n=1 Tax=Pedobacter antarcticus TaxID=34086 RepID=UPI00293120D4|nr:hypothetical protein [Pedobacter antarcticus]